MMKKYYIQAQEEVAKDVFATWGIRVLSSENVENLPQVKEPYVEDWPDEQGSDEYLPEATLYSSKEVVLNLLIQTKTQDELEDNVADFMNYISSHGSILYYEEYGRSGFRGRYKGSTITTKRYRSGQCTFEFSISFVVPQLCFAVGTENDPLVSLEVNDRYQGEDREYELFFSDGRSGTFNDDIVLESEGVLFAVALPSYLDLLTINTLEALIVGFEYNGENIIVGDDDNNIVGL
jgi:hypothetical protein